MLKLVLLLNCDECFRLVGGLGDVQLVVRSGSGVVRRSSRLMLLGRYLQLLLLIDIRLGEIRLLFLRSSCHYCIIGVRRSAICLRMHFIVIVIVIFCPIVGRI